jgi:PAS domain S-box-containing protein
VKASRRHRTSRRSPASQLRVRLAEAEATLRAIRNGEVDAVVVAGKTGPQVFTLEGADHAYRILIESMHEGAVTLAADATILYANQCFARMVKCPLEQLTGSLFHRLLDDDGQVLLRPLLKQPDKTGSKIQARLKASHGSILPVQISIRPLAKNNSNRAAIGLVVTDQTAVRRSEEMLRALTHRVVAVQEAERGRIALELHDHITQLLCALLVRSQALSDQLPPDEGPAKKEAIKLRELLGEAADEVERISRGLRPGLLEHLGLVAVLRDTAAEFAKRTGVKVRLNCQPLTERLPANIELALYRIIQEALRNVDLHAQVHHVTVQLKRLGDVIRLNIKDDGIGFDPEHLPASRKTNRGLGLLGMRERATYVGGVLKLIAAYGHGTEIQVEITLPSEPDRVTG